jgi:hypothetical protein
MAMNETDVPSSAQGIRRPMKTKRFWNWKLIGIEGVATGLGVVAFCEWAPGLQGTAGFVIAILGLWSLSREVRGVAINTQMIALPSNRWRRFPILYSGRRRVHPGSLRQLTVTRPWYSFQIVRIQGDFGMETLMFQTRRQRQRFMSVVEAICPNAEIFRESRRQDREANPSSMSFEQSRSEG